MDLSIKRILKDVKMLRSGNLESLGIYYKHNEDNIYNIKVLMIGPNDTPYNYGYYLFNITFPPNYPFSPPSVKYYTQGEQIRFNPNLYTNGKVCLSLLNTWNGPQWSSCNSLLSILISMQSMILIKNPIINEPGYENDTSEHALKYTQIIEYSNYNIAICKMINETPSKFIYFKDIMIENFKKNYINIIIDINKLIEKYLDNSNNVNCKIYAMCINTDFKMVLDNINLLHSIC